MKPFFLSLILIFFCLFTIGQTPVVITEADIASAGDSYLISNANPVIFFDPDDTGADHTWDFSSLEPLYSDTSAWLNEEETNPIYFFLWFASDIAEQSVSDIVNDYITVEDVFNFYAKDEEEFALTGFAGTIGGIPLPISFSDQDLIYRFPIEYGNSFSSTGSFSIDIPGIGSWSETRNRTTTADGWGTVTTPYHGYDVLRTKSVSLIDDVVTYDAIEIPFSYTSTEYKWLAKNSGIPVLQINSQTILGTETITQIIYRDTMIASPVVNTSGVYSVQLINSFIQDELIVQAAIAPGTDLKAEVIDLNGRVIHTYENLKNGSNRLAISEHIPAGLYLLNLGVDQHIISSNKFFKLN